VSEVETLPETIAKAKKVELLSRANDAARSAGAAIKQVSVSYGDSRRRFVVANSDGVYTEDDQVRTRFVVHCVASGDEGMQTAFGSVGQTMGFELFARHDVETLARDTANTAIRKLRAQPAPSGPMPVVLEHGAGGVLFHEACGHGLEADHIAKGASVFAGKKGELIASPLVTLIDDGTVGGEWGAFGVDDEGHESKRNTLIENGVLSDYMWDYIRATKEHREFSGNGRRQSYHHLPMVRMTNTFLTNGDTDPAEIIRQTERGIYVAQLAGGNVNTATGDFTFSISEAYLIEHGEITKPVREANLMGNGPEVLKHIDAVGNDFAFGWPGTCGKNGQSVPVGQGQPTLRVASGLTIGGTAA
jgi:TldD protein